MTLDVIYATKRFLVCLLLSCGLFLPAFVSPAGAAANQGKPLAESDVLRLLREKVSANDLLSRIHQDKISFPMTKPVIDELKGAGASRPVLEALRAAQPVGLVWSRPAQFTLSDNAMVEITPLVVDGGHDYFACTDDEHHVSLVTNGGGAWEAYPVAPDLSVGNNVGARIIGLTVHQGIAYVAMIPNLSGNMRLMLAYNPSGKPAGPWIRVPIYSTDSSYLENPSLAVAGDQLIVAFDDVNPKKGSGDVFLGKIPLSGISGKGSAPSVSFSDLSTADDFQGGPSDMRPQVIASQGKLNIVWEKAGKTVVFGQAQIAAGLDALQQTEVLNTVSNPTDKSLQLAASGDTQIVARFADDSNGNHLPGCCVALVSSDAGGRWSTQSVGRTNLALQAPGIAVGDCGPSLAYVQAMSGNRQRLVVATFADGQWRTVELSEESANQPRLSATTTGLDLVYVSAVGQITVRSAVCYPPPAPLD